MLIQQRVFYHICYKLMLGKFKINSLQLQMQAQNLNLKRQQNNQQKIKLIIQWIHKSQTNILIYSFKRIKLKVAQQKIKLMQKNGQFHSVSSYESVKSNNPTDNSSIISYISINDFKPILENYSSVKMLDSNYQTNKSQSRSNDNDFNYQTRIRKLIQNQRDMSADKQTFLQNWMIRDTANLDYLMFEEYPYSNYCFKKIKSYHQQALQSIKIYNFHNYCKQNLKKTNSFLFFKQSNPLKYKKQPISDSLTHLNQIHIEKALSIFQCLLKAGGQIQSERHQIQHIYDILQLLHQSNDDLIQQAYMQIIKQLTSKKIWYMKIFCCLAVTVKPSTRMYLPLLNYLNEQNTTVQQNAIKQQHFNYAFFHLIKNFDNPRTSLPSFYQLQCFMNLKKIPIILNFPKQKTFFIESYTTVEELIHEIIEFYDIDDRISYLLMINGKFLEKGILLDKLNFYQKKDSEKKKDDYINFNGFKAIIVLKNMEDAKKSNKCFNIIYNYHVYQHLRGLFALKSKQIVQIGGLIMYSQIHDEESYDFDLKNLLSARKRKKIFQQGESKQEYKEKYKKHILNEYFKFSQTKIQARKKIVEILSQSKGYKTHFFKCLVFLDEFQQVQSWVGIQKNKFIFIDPQSGRFTRSINFKTISEWGFSKSQVCMKVKCLGKLHIDSVQIDVFVSIFENYLNYLYTNSSCLGKNDD